MTKFVLIAFLILSFVVVEALADVVPATGAASLSEAALGRIHHRVTYDGRYTQMDYPMGDVAPDKGVCTDVVVRSYRALGIDLQRRIHEDMEAEFSSYPDHWGLSSTDQNIDHRRVPNIRRFLERQGAELAALKDPKTYQPGDLVTWNLGTFLPHIGIVTDKIALGGNPMIVHNIGRGPQLEDMLFDYKITGHYRYFPEG
jgi:uncharacterized protein